jgi:hypothetical protein
MVKRLRFQENRSTSRRRRRQPHERWVIEPLDIALVAAIVLILFWLQWLLGALPGA